jgi:hypothetical protein
MAITVIDEGMESAEDSIAKGDDGESSSSKDVDMDDGLEKEKASCCLVRLFAVKPSLTSFPSISDACVSRSG